MAAAEPGAAPDRGRIPGFAHHQALAAPLQVSLVVGRTCKVKHSAVHGILVAGVISMKPTAAGSAGRWSALRPLAAAAYAARCMDTREGIGGRERHS